MATIRDRYVLEVDTQGGVRNLLNATGATGRLGGALKGIGPLAAAAGGALAAIGVADFVSSVAEVTARTEDLKTALETVTGSTENADQAFEFINDFATRTPFNIEQLTETFIRLKAAGIEPTEELLTSFGDAASVTTDKVGSLDAMAALFSRTVSGGLGLEELERLADRGIDVYGILEEQIGITRQEVSEFGKTAEGAQQIRDALLAGFDEEFGGGMARASDNISVAFSNMEIAADNALLAVGEGGLGKGLQYAAEAITELLGQNSELADSLGSVLGEAVITATDAIVGLIEKIQEGGPTLDLIGTAVSGIAEVFGTLWEASGQVVEALEPLTSVIFPALGEGIEFLVGVITTLIEGFADLVSGISEAITSANSFGEAVTGAFSAITETVVNTVRNLVNTVIDLFQGLYDALWGNSIIRDLIDGIIEGFTNLGPQLIDIVKNMVTALIDVFKGLWSSITEGISNAVSASLDKIGKAFDDFTNWFSGNGESVEDAAEGTKTALEKALNADGITNDVVRATSQELQSLVDSLNSSVDPLDRHTEKLETLNELNVSFQENTESLTELLQDYSETVDELNEIQSQSIEFQTELNELSEQYNEFLETENELTSAKLDITESLNELSEVQNELMAQFIELAENSNELVEQSNTVNQSALEILEQIADVYPELNSAISRYVDFLTRLIERTNQSTSANDRLAESMRRVAEASREAQNAAAAAEAAINSATSAQNSFDSSDTSSSSAPTQSNDANLFDRLFGGFFANGGTIPSGQFGVVGERGAELITGPATVTPMDAMQSSTAVTYNINAVDARSFRDLVARDPGFIHAVAQKGASATPRRRR